MYHYDLLQMIPHFNSTRYLGGSDVWTRSTISLITKTCRGLQYTTEAVEGSDSADQHYLLEDIEEYGYHDRVVLPRRPP